MGCTCPALCVDLDFCLFDSIACEAKLVTLDRDFVGAVLARHFVLSRSRSWLVEHISRVSVFLIGMISCD